MVIRLVKLIMSKTFKVRIWMEHTAWVTEVNIKQYKAKWNIK